MTVDNDDEIELNFKYAQALGATGIVMAPTHAVLPRIEKFVKKYNIKAMIHNHGPEDKNFPSPQTVLDAVKNMDEADWVVASTWAIRCGPGPMCWWRSRRRASGCTTST
jgi:hypothetical protein